MPTTLTFATFAPVAFVACAASACASEARGQGATGGMVITVTVLEPVRPIALLRPLQAATVHSAAEGSYASVSLGVSLETPFTVRVRTTGSDSARGVAPSVRLHGGAPAPLGTGMVTLSQAVPAGAHDLAIEFTASDGDASWLELPATEVTITTIDGDAVTEATATFAAASLPLPVVARAAAATTIAPGRVVALSSTRGRGRE